jgi:hypothetical protein
MSEASVESPHEASEPSGQATSGKGYNYISPVSRFIFADCRKHIRCPLSGGNG